MRLEKNSSGWILNSFDDDDGDGSLCSEIVSKITKQKCININ